jgi:signal transduction histidine kinase
VQPGTIKLKREEPAGKPAHDDAVEAVGRIAAVPRILDVLCRLTGMGFAAVARVTDDEWTACATLDHIAFGLKPGEQLDVSSTLCSEVRASRVPIVISQASTDPVYCRHHTPHIYRIESYISVPIVLADGSYFGNLCAIDPNPKPLSDPHILSSFEMFAELIALHLDDDRQRRQAQTALREELTFGERRERFIGVLAHDLRNPLSAIATSSIVLGRIAQDDTVRDIAQRIDRSVRRMSGLINDLLDLTRGRLGGGLTVDRRLVDDLDEAFAAVVDELRDSRPGRAVDTRIDIARPVLCDRARLQQLVSNLLDNALKHGTGATPVTFRAALEDDALVIEIGNDGEPIPEEIRQKMFAPFWQGATRTGQEGLGLGLFICARIVEAHGGTIDVMSSHGQGTRLTVRIPLQAAA